MILILFNIVYNLFRFGLTLKLWRRKKEMRRENATINILLKCWLLNEEQSCILLLMLNANIGRFDLLCTLRLPQIRWNGVEKSRYHFIQFQSNRIESNSNSLWFELRFCPNLRSTHFLTCLFIWCAYCFTICSAHCIAHSNSALCINCFRNCNRWNSVAVIFLRFQLLSILAHGLALGFQCENLKSNQDQYQNHFMS